MAGSIATYRIYRGVGGWTRAYRRWLSTVRFDHPAQQIVLQDYIHAVEDVEFEPDPAVKSGS
jgi:transposase